MVQKSGLVEPWSSGVVVGTMVQRGEATNGCVISSFEQGCVICFDVCLLLPRASMLCCAALSEVLAREGVTDFDSFAVLNNL